MFSGERKVTLPKNLREILKGNDVPEVKPLLPKSIVNQMKHTTLQEEAELSSMQLIKKHA
jgi:hypothetical protein